MTNISRKGVWAIVLGALATATLIFFAWATSGFRNWDAASWFNYWWGLNKPAVVRVAEPSAEQQVMALTSSDDYDIDHTFVHDSDEVSTTFAVSRAAAPSVKIEYPGDTSLSSVACCGTRVSISVENEHVGVVYTSGTVNIYVYAHVISGPPVSLGSYSFTVTSENQTYYLESDELDTLFQKAAVKNYNVIEVSATLSNVSGYSNSPESAKLVLYDLSDHTAEFNYSGSTVTLPLDSDLVSKNAYSVSVESKGTSSNVVACKSLYDSTKDIGNAITLVDNSFVIDISKVSFFENSTSTETTYIRLVISSTALGVNAFYGTSWLYSYFAISKLPAPTNLTYNAGTLTWNAVSGANRYGVFWTDSNGVEQHVVVTDPTYTFDLNDLGSGEYTVRIRALGNIGENIADSEAGTMQLTAYNASNTVTQLVGLTLSVNGDNITKLVPYGKNVSDYCYEVNVPNKEFGGWYYDDGFSRPVVSTDVLNGDTIIYARLSDKKVAENTLSWWDQYKWYVIAAIAVVVVGGVVAAIIIRKKKAA